MPKRAEFRPNRVPRPCFASLEEINRHKRLILGLPICRLKKRVPWGYECSPDDPNWLLPKTEQLKVLFRVKDFLCTCSFHEVAKWLTFETKDPISYEGLRNLMLTRMPLKEIELPLEERERLYLQP